MSKLNLTRRGVIKTGAAAGTALAMPTILTAGSHAGFTNAPQAALSHWALTCHKPDRTPKRGMDELRAKSWQFEHLNGEGDGGMMNTFSSKASERQGILGKKVEFVTGDTQTKSDAARASAKSMIEKDGAIMVNGGSSSGVAIAVQGLCQEAGIIFHGRV